MKAETATDSGGHPVRHATAVNKIATPSRVATGHREKMEWKPAAHRRVQDDDRHDGKPDHLDAPHGQWRPAVSGANFSEPGSARDLGYFS